MRFSNYLTKLHQIVYIYNTDSTNEKISILQSIAKTKWANAVELKNYVELLLFMVAYPENNAILNLVTAEFNRIITFFENPKNQVDKSFADAGFPYTEMYTQYSHDILTWLRAQSYCKISIESFDETGVDLNSLLRTTLLNIEREETMASLSNTDLLSVLKIPEQNQISFLLNEFSKLNTFPYVKDYLWDAMKMWVTIKSTHKNYSRILNKIQNTKTYFQSEIIKKFDSEALIQSPLPAAKILSNKEKTQLIRVIKNSLTLTMRETDPATYLDTDSLLFFELERGISIALYGLEASRQLPLQSYIGYTVFKNAYPVAYGGSWIFGATARFGLNIFEAYRGGESGYVMCQLLRVYKQVFALDNIEVDSYMYGRNNPDGIKSGAFWFYYRYGFRLIDPPLQQLAEKELLKINASKNYRTSEKTLLKFTDSDIRLVFKKSKQLDRVDILNKISNMIAKDFKNDRIVAEKASIAALKQKTNINFTTNQLPALTEFALAAKAMKWNSASQIKLITSLIQLKSTNVVAYNIELKELILK